MTQLKRSRPLVAYAEIPPPRYYQHVAQHMLKVVEERTLAAIVQRNSDVKLVKSVRTRSGLRRPIMVLTPSQIVKMAKKGAVDIMFSVTKVKEELPDVYVIDIKADKHVWIHEKNWYIFDLMVQIVSNFFKALGLERQLICFDGMNGYKVITLLDVEELKQEVKSRGELMRLLNAGVELIRDIAMRVVKHYRNLIGDLDLFSHMLISGNTTTKIGLCRVPLSLHWSTKLVAVPLPVPVREFSVTQSLPTRVIEKAQAYGEVIERCWSPNSPRTFIHTVRKYVEERDVETVYKLKSYVLSHIQLE